MLSNIWSCYHIDLNSFNFSVIHCKIHTSSCTHISFSHGTKQNVFFSDIKSSTQTSNFLLCHLLQNLASSLVSLFPWILLLSPYCFLPLCLLPPSSFLSNCMCFWFFFPLNRTLLERLFMTQWISAPLSYSSAHKHSTADVYMKGINACPMTRTSFLIPVHQLVGNVAFGSICYIGLHCFDLSHSVLVLELKLP